MAKITVYLPDQAPLTFDFGDREELTVGRGETNDIVIDHESVSTQHCVFRKIGETSHILVDQGSTNGIYLENNPVSQATLTHGSAFHVGHIPAHYEVEGEAPISAAPPASANAAATGFGAPAAQIPEVSVRPAGFRDMSPVKRVEQTDSFSKIATVLGWIAIASAVILAITSFLI